MNFDEMAAHFDRGLRLFEPITAPLLDHLSAGGTSALDIASGTGEPGLTWLRRAPGHRLLGIDSSAPMVELARRKAAAEGLPGARFEVMDAQRLDLPDAAVDTVLSRMGMLSFGDPVAGAGEAVRVLRPGGSLSIACWDATSKNILAYATMAALGDRLPATVRSLFDRLEELAMPGRRERWLRDAGLSAVDSELFGWTLPFRSEAEMWEATAGPGLFQSAIAGLGPDELAAVRRRFGSLLAEYRTADGTYALPYHCRLIWGVR